MSRNALVIEDDQDLAEIFSDALRSGGYDVEACLDGEDARRRLWGPVPDLVVLDLHLPHVSGIELLDLIHRDPRYALTTIAIATADSDLANRVVNDAHIVLAKPVSFKQLRRLTTLY